MHMTMISAARWATTMAAIALVAADAGAQQAPATLSLDEAVQLAHRYSPGYRQQANDQAVADWNVRSAYGTLLPSVTARTGVDWEAGGLPRVGNFSAEDLGLSKTPDYLYSSYGLTLNLTLSGGTFFRMAQERAAREATYARIDAASYTLRSSITRQYLSAMRARDAVELAQRELKSADDALNLAQARFAAGGAARLDVTQAEVDRGRAEVALLQAQAAEQTEQLRLLQQIGLDFEGEVELTTRPAVFEPTWTLEQLTREALQQHPQLVSARATESASRAAARSARMQYLPTLSIGGGWYGYTRSTRNEQYLIDNAENSAKNRIDSCHATNDLYSRLANPLPAQDCARFELTDAQRQSILAANDVFPFNFTRQPPSFGMTLSMPILNGFTREAQVQTAAAAADDARHQRREQELEQRTSVATSYLALQTAYRSVSIEERNVAAAAEQLELATERYRLGAGSILELSQAQATKARADQSHLAALYAFHENLAALESAVGRQLR
jgi:outer membrane protein